MTSDKITEDQVHAECRKLYPDFPLGWSFAAAHALLRKMRMDMEVSSTKQKLRLIQ